METYQHFGLSAAPFDGRPDPRFFYGTPNCAETLATLQYAVGSGKACTLVLGESGSGKTLLGRVLVQRLGTRSHILWLRGLGQPGKTVATVVCGGAGLAPSGGPTTQAGMEIPLTQWLRTTRAGPLRRQDSSATLIVDDADGLRTTAWEDILSLLADSPLKGAAPRVTAVIFGLPTLLDAVRLEPRAPAGKPGNPLVRLQHRLFRVCHLAPLTREEAAGFVRHRISAAGGKDELFTPAALGLVHDLSEGNPALVNQLCDNALVEAFGEEKPRVDSPHVLAAAASITGQVQRREEPEAFELPEYAAPSRPIHEESLLLARLRSVAGPPAGASPLGCDPLADRLHSLQARLTEALTHVRTARAERVAPASTVGPASSRSTK